MDAAQVLDAATSMRDRMSVLLEAAAAGRPDRSEDGQLRRLHVR